MTSPYVTFPQPPTQAAPRPSAWPVLRAILAAFLVLAAVFGYLVAGFAAVITWTGCFIGCSDPDHADGAALALLAMALLTAGPGLNALLYRSRVWLWVAAALDLVGAVLLALAMFGN